MTIDITIRPERAADEGAIRDLTQAAFEGERFSDGDEHELIDRLRRAGDLALSLVAQGPSGVVGHIAFSRVAIADGSDGWFGLAPVSVHPSRQGQGIGSALIERGIADLRTSGARGIVLLGSPRFYGRFGFEHDPALTYPGPPAEYFQRLVLAGKPPSGVVRYVSAFGG